jgi:5-methylcytosine-specific restriction endonuclease McrA
MSLVYTFDPDSWHLGSLCKRGHRWPGTDQSLKRTSCGANSKSVHPCAGCSTAKSDWLVRFVDSKGSGAPDGFRLGPLCLRSHRWNGLDVSLRRGSHCIQCAKEKPRDKEKAKQSGRAHYLQNKDRYIERAKTRYQRTMADGSQQEYRQRVADRRLAENMRVRRKSGARDLTEIKLKAAIKRAGQYPTPLSLVLKEQQNFWRANPALKSKEVRRCRQHNWGLRYMVDEDLRLYTRNKSKARKAKMRQTMVERITPAQIRLRFAQFDNSCAYCCKSGCDLHIEHLMPIAAGGPHTMDNILPSCSECNFSKSHRPPLKWYSEQPFFSRVRWQRIVEVLSHATA